MDGAGLLFDFEDEDWGVGPAPGFRRRRERVFRPRVNLEWQTEKRNQAINTRITPVMSD